MAIKIKRTVENRYITEQEFKKQKSAPEYSVLRQAAKQLNFLMIFGGGAKMFAENALVTEWSLDQINAFITDNNLEDFVKECEEKYKNEDPTKVRYIAVAQKMKDNFFSSYPGLQKRIEREANFAMANGYCRSVFGDVRNLIELKLQGEWDKKHLSGMLSNLTNVSSNYRAQNYESCTRGKAMRQMVDWLEDNHYISFVDNEIHDSIDACVWKTELVPFLAHIKHLCERQVPEYGDKWIPLNVDCEISDIKKGQYYKGGSSPESYGIQWEGLEFEDPDPFGVELSPEYEDNYFKKRQEHWHSQGKRDPLQVKINEYIAKRNG